MTKNDKSPLVRLDFLLPLGLLLFFTALLRWSDLDLRVESLFYDPVHGWEAGNGFPWLFLYRYGFIPALVLAGGSLLTLALSLFFHGLAPFRKQALFFVLLLITGPGLVVNVMFKDHWGRPRPRQVQMFAGEEKFLPVWEKGIGGAGRSFPSGHASMGFFLLSPFFVLRRRQPRAAQIFLALGLGYGALMGLGRMIQGGHFASDVLWSAGFVYFCGLALYYLLHLDRDPGLPAIPDFACKEKSLL